MLPRTTTASLDPTDYPLKGLVLPRLQLLDDLISRRGQNNRPSWAAAGKHSFSRSLFPIRCICVRWGGI